MEIGTNGTSDLYLTTPVVTEQKRGSLLFVFENDQDRQIAVKGEKLQYSDGEVISGKIDVDILPECRRGNLSDNR